jgi:hypothetical protein
MVDIGPIPLTEIIAIIFLLIVTCLDYKWGLMTALKLKDMGVVEDHALEQSMFEHVQSQI